MPRSAARSSGRKDRAVAPTRWPVLTVSGLRHACTAFLIGILALTPALSSPADAQSNGGPPAMRIVVDSVKVQAMQQTVPVIGRLVPRKRGVVAARIAGPIAAFNVEVGDRVEQGDILAELVTEPLTWDKAFQEADVARARAASETARETLKLRQQELSRLEGLRQSAAFSQARLDDKRQEVAVAQAEIAEANAELQSARASLRLAEIQLEDARVQAPYAGVVAVRHTEKGAYVRLGDPLVTLVDDSNLEVEVEVPSRNIGGVRPGRELPVILTDGRVFIAAVRAVVPEENPQTRTQIVRLTLSAADKQGQGLAANQTVTVDVPASAADAVLTVSKDAILNRQGATQVYVIIDGKAAVRPVQVGEAVGSRFVVLSGLEEGELVAVRGNERMRPGQRVQFDPPAPANASTPGQPGPG